MTPGLRQIKVKANGEGRVETKFLDAARKMPGSGEIGRRSEGSRERLEAFSLGG